MTHAAASDPPRKQRALLRRLIQVEMEGIS